MNQLDWKSVLLAKHAQHVVLIHFPIALFIVAVGFDVLSQRLRRRQLADAAYYNLVVAAIFTVPTMLSGLAAWQWLLQGHRLKGVLLYHLAFAVASTMVILVSEGVYFREGWYGEDERAAATWELTQELRGVLRQLDTVNLGGFL